MKDASYRVFKDAFLEAEVGADEGEGDGDAEPESDQSQNGEEGQRCRRAVRPQHKVQQQRNPEHHPARTRSQLVLQPRSGDKEAPANSREPQNKFQQPGSSG